MSGPVGGGKSRVQHQAITGPEPIPKWSILTGNKVMPLNLSRGATLEVNEEDHNSRFLCYY